jgi:large subunit ribosomal protein L9
MPNTIQVILQQDVPTLGKTGELVKVRPGYARNYLLPNSIAMPATSKNVHRLAHEKKAAEARNSKAKAEAQEVANKIGALSLTLARKAGEEGKLYGAVTSKEIESALREKGVEIDRRKIQLAEPIKQLGDYELSIKLGYDVTATIKVAVTAR